MPVFKEAGFERVKSVTILIDEKLMKVSFIKSRPKC